MVLIIVLRKSDGQEEPEHHGPSLVNANPRSSAK